MVVGGDSDSWGPRRRVDNSMVRFLSLFLFLSTIALPLSLLCCCWSGLAWPVPAPHGHSVFSTVSPHACPIACVSVFSTSNKCFAALARATSSFLFADCAHHILRSSTYYIGLLELVRVGTGTSDQCDLAHGLAAPCRVERIPTLCVV